MQRNTLRACADPGREEVKRYRIEARVCVLGAIDGLPSAEARCQPTGAPGSPQQHSRETFMAALQPPAGAWLVQSSSVNLRGKHPPRATIFARWPDRVRWTDCGVRAMARHRRFSKSLCRPNLSSTSFLFPLPQHHSLIAPCCPFEARRCSHNGQAQERGACQRHGQEEEGHLRR